MGSRSVQRCRPPQRTATLTHDDLRVDSGNIRPDSTPDFAPVLPLPPSLWGVISREPSAQDDEAAL